MDPWHEIKRKLDLRWKKRWVRVLVGIFCLIAAISIQGALSILPSAVDVEKKGYTPARSKANRQEIVLHNPSFASEEPFLFYQGKPDETIEFYTDRARLTKETFEDYNSDKKTPGDDRKISYTVSDIPDDHDSRSDDSGDSTESSTKENRCVSTVSVSLVNPTKPPSEIHFYTQGASSARSRRLEITVTNADVQISLSQSQPERNPLPVGCGKILLVGDWRLSIDGFADPSFIVPAGSPFKIDFLKIDADHSFDDDKSSIEPFSLRDHPVKLSSLTINSRNGPAPTATPDLEVKAKGDTSLTIYNLRVEKDDLTVEFSGVGTVKSSGVTVSTFNLLEYVSTSYLGAAILTMFNGGLLTWVVYISRKKKTDVAGKR
jgi:hypothetical protein